jgi:phospholipase/lecithinase/hemolysin
MPKSKTATPTMSESDRAFGQPHQGHPPEPDTPATPATLPRAVTGPEVDALKREYEALRKKAQAVEVLEEAYKAKLEDIVSRMNAHGTKVVAGRVGSLSVTQAYYPSIKDWQAVWDAIRKEKTYPPLLRKQLNDATWREMFLGKKLVPGTEAFTKPKASLTKKA